MPKLSTTLARQLHRACIAALVLLSLFLSPTFAAAPIAGPGKGSPNIGGPASGGEITSPGDPFKPERPERANGTNPSPFSPEAPQSRVPKHELPRGFSKAESPFAVDCVFYGKDWVLVNNLTDVTIPAGTWFAISYPVNKVWHFQLLSDLEPGYGKGTKIPGDTEGLPCDAWVWKTSEPPEISEGKMP